MIFVFKELTIWLIRPNIAKHSGSFGNCEVSDIDNRLHRSQRRWRSLRIWGGQLGLLQECATWSVHQKLYRFCFNGGEWRRTFYVKRQFSSVQSLSRVWLFVTPSTAAHQASLSITNSQNLPKLMSIELVMPSNHHILCRPLLLPSIFLNIWVFSNESALCIRWTKNWSYSFSISPSNWCWTVLLNRTPRTDLL